MIAYYLSMVKTDEDKNKVIFIYESFYSFMCYTAGQVLSNKYDIEDAVHNAMIKLIENIDIIDISNVKRAKNLCGIVSKNKAIDHLRAKENQKTSLEEEVVEPQTEQGDPEDMVIKKDTYDIILKAIKELDDKYRDICIMKYVHGLKEREIAELLDMAPKTVCTRIIRGKQSLRTALGKAGINV